jgi:hypothetical protein
VYGRTDRFIFKTAAFYKRNKKFIGHKLYHVWEELVKVGQGFRALKNDFYFYLKVHKSKASFKYDSISYKQELKIKQVQTDFIKFIPFSLFIIVPGLELLLPAWLVIFPNSKPSQFLSDAERARQFKILDQQRNVAAEKLLYILPKYLYMLEKDQNVDAHDLADIKKLKHILRSEDKLPTDLL